MQSIVIIPTYNEAPNVERLVTAIHQACPPMDILIVDDESPDGTGRIADQVAARDAQVAVLHRAPPRGRGLAGRDGYLAALNRGAEAILEMDADFSHDPALLPRFLEELKRGADVVLGSRFVSGGSDVDRGRVRRSITVLANAFIRFVLRVPVGDCNSGYRAFRRSALLAIDPATLTSTGPSIVQEVLYRAHRARLCLVEIPLRFVDRKEGDSKLGLKLLIEGYFMI
ncbi:MAG TPA: polyprenol monophosphomannose synthase, partial [bacterium]|nr:polyprenol monophosphomannose synthase [bacterium]